jgi:hypothetical protein
VIRIPHVSPTVTGSSSRCAVAKAECAIGFSNGSAILAECCTSGRSSFGACFKCGLTSHIAKNCPNRQLTQGANLQQCSQGLQTFTYGKVNHLTAEEAQQSQDTVLGMFLTNSQRATILFDSGASHSIITSKFVAKINLRITIMNYTMIVSSPRSEMKTKHICPAISIAIRG